MNLRNLNVLGYAAGFTLWIYRVPAGKAEPVSSAGYFDAAADMFCSGDALIISSDRGVLQHSLKSENGRVTLGRFLPLLVAHT